MGIPPIKMQVARLSQALPYAIWSIAASGTKKLPCNTSVSLPSSIYILRVSLRIHVFTHMGGCYHINVVNGIQPVKLLMTYLEGSIRIRENSISVWQDSEKNEYYSLALMALTKEE